MKILILKPSSLGDVIHALPVLRLLKLHDPRSQVYWWLEEGLTPLLKDDPDLAGIFPFHRSRWAAPDRWPEIRATVRAMRREKFDVAIDLQGLARSAVFTWLSKSELSVGLDNPREGAREGANVVYDKVAPRAPEGTHAVDRYLAVLPLLNVPVHSNFEWLPERVAAAERVKQQTPAGAGRWISLLPGARWDNKRWPVENFKELTREMLRRMPDARIRILGAGSDRQLGSAIAATDPARCHDLTGESTMHEMVEWIRNSDLVITNDTGPMHVAAALRKPIVAIFGPTDPKGTGPYGQLGHVIQITDLECVPCMKSRCGYKEDMACLKRITPAQVADAAERRLAMANADRA